MFQADVVEGVHRIEDAFVNWYLIEDEGRLTAVDAGVPRSWDSLHLPDRDVLLAGDSVVTLNPYTGSRGPQIVARAATADSRQALSSLDAIAQTAAKTVLTGHGPLWTQGAEQIAQRARAAGLS